MSEQSPTRVGPYPHASLIEQHRQHCGFVRTNPILQADLDRRKQDASVGMLHPKADSEGTLRFLRPRLL
jgi:hypothetical protein